MFTKATKEQSRLRMALMGISGGGKTFTALRIASYLGKTIALIDSEHGSASKYAALDDADPSNGLFQFDTCELQSFHPTQYINAIRAAETAGYDVLIIDSLSHAWMGKDGALELVDRAAKRNTGGNSFAAWREVTPLHNALIEAILACKCHVIVTLRAKQEYVLETNDKGKTAPRKVGLAPVQRDSIEFEFDVVGEMNLENDLIITKTRCPALAGAVFSKPGIEIADTLKAWLSSGSPAKPKVDREVLIGYTSQEMNRLGWSPDDGKKHLLAVYNKISRQLLSDKELIDFLTYLQQQDSTLIPEVIS